MKKHTHNERILLTRKGLWVIFSSLFFLAAVVSTVPAQDAVPLKPFQPPAGSNYDTKDVSDMVGRYFDFHGPIDYITADRIVIYDTNFAFAPELSGTAGLRQGMYVGLKLNSDRKVVEIERLQKPREGEE